MNSFMSRRSLNSSSDLPDRRRAFTVRLVAMFAASLLIGLWPGQGSVVTPAFAANSITIKLAHVGTPGSPEFAGAARFASDVAAFSNGAMNVQVYPAAQLGGEAELVQSVIAGNLTMALVNSGVLTKYDKRLGVIQLPFLTKHSEDLVRAANSAAGDRLVAGLPQKIGIRVIGFMAGTPRDFVMRNSPCTTVGALKGLKIRSLQSPVTVEFIHSLGALPVSLGMTQVYSALQTGLIDGADWVPTLIAGYSLPEVAKYIVKLHWTATPYALVTEQAWWKTLNPAQQDILRRALTDAASYEDTQMGALVAKAYAQAQAKGMKIITPNLSGFRAAVEHEYTTVWDKEYGTSLIDDIRQSAGG